jgi:hypothetical protein
MLEIVQSSNVVNRYLKNIDTNLLCELKDDLILTQLSGVHKRYLRAFQRRLISVININADDKQYLITC